MPPEEPPHRHAEPGQQLSRVQYVVLTQRLRFLAGAIPGNGSMFRVANPYRPRSKAQPHSGPFVHISLRFVGFPNLHGQVGRKMQIAGVAFLNASRSNLAYIGRAHRIRV